MAMPATQKAKPLVADSTAPQPLPPALRQAIARTQRLAKTAPPITTNPERMGGTPVIGIQRLPVKTLLDHLIAGATVDEFAAEFDCEATRVRAALQCIRDALDEGLLTEALAAQVDY